MSADSKDDDKKREDFMTGAVDYGRVPPTRELSEEEKKIATFTMAANAAVIQFMLEGIIPIEHQIHFMVHMQDFTARLWKGEEIRFPDVKQTLSLDSEAGRMYADAASDALLNGSKNYKAVKELSAAVKESREQTNNLDGTPSVDKPRTFH